jgi:hypothetical protein
MPVPSKKEESMPSVTPMIDPSFAPPPSDWPPTTSARSDGRLFSNLSSLQTQDGRPPRSARDILFTPPKSVAEARRRIADLDYDIAHIDQQFAAKKARGGANPDWAHRANRARMLKDLERSRLRIWVEEARGGESWDLLKAIVETVKPDYEPDEWKEVLAEARNKLRQP